MKNQAQIGVNLTGFDIHPSEGEKMKSAAEQTGIGRAIAEDALSMPRSRWMKNADPVGSIPVPSEFKGVFKMGSQMMKGVRPQALVDKLGERLAFERSGVRLYDALITKCENSELDIDVDRLRHFQKEEAEHFKMLEEVMRSIGADPTAVTPGADVMAVASMGLFQVLGDPRTTPLQALEAILVAELTDNDGWELLIQLAKEAGMKEEEKKFRHALLQEEQHLHGIRSMVQDLTLKEGRLLQ